MIKRVKNSSLVERFFLLLKKMKIKLELKKLKRD